MPICNLCLEDKVLVRSHIFPEFMYTPLYNERNQFMVLENQGRGIVGHRPQGIYSRLLCANCDNNIIGKYENYASGVIFSDQRRPIQVEEKEYGFLFHGIDYTLFKLFQISLLWRASISNRPEIPSIDLGPHKEIMRQMLLNENPFEYFRYGVQMYFFPASSRNMIDLIVAPSFLPKLIDGHETYRAIFNGVCWFFIMSGPTKYYKERNYFLSADGKLPIINAGSVGEKFVYQLAFDFLGNK